MGRIRAGHKARAAREKNAPMADSDWGPIPIGGRFRLGAESDWGKT